MVDAWSFSVHSLLPPCCVLCGAAGQAPALDLCAGCDRDLPLNAPACVRCGQPLAGATPGPLTCGRCLARPPAFDAAHCALRYEYPVDRLVKALKYDGRVVLARVLGHLLLRHLLRVPREAWPDCIVPVPLAAARYRERGFNQATEIAAWLGRGLGLPLRTDLVERVRETREQAALPADERRRNVRGAFAARGRPSGPHVAIVDDVVTTGSTLDEIARQLRRRGVVRIEAWAVAHAGT